MTNLTKFQSPRSGKFESNKKELDDILSEHSKVSIP